MSYILKSPLDTKEYREITLRNGLTALLISDMERSSPIPCCCPRKKSPKRRKASDTGSESESASGTGSDSETPMSEDDSTVDPGESTYRVPADIEGLEAMWAKDVYPKGKKAAAALCVSVGSFADPDDIPGFAHFLEHMVFMGSKKYKKENAFDDFIGKHGGETNAWTDCERTTFFFDIQKQHFHKALDMFACFFISPLFLKGSVDREINAVDNEFQMIKPNDTERGHQLLGLLAQKDNPMGRFMCGNSKTLKTIPQEQGIDVYGRLRDFYKSMYSAHYMTLVVQAPESLDDLQDLVYDVFEDIPNNGALAPSFPECQDPFWPANFHKLFKVVPVEDTHKLDIVWALPPLIKYFKAKPLDYLAVNIAHEGPGSIIAYLRKKAWALSLVGGNVGNGYDQNTLWSGFFISIVLTDLGLKNVSDVIRTVFEYIALLQKTGPQPSFFRELQDIENIKFRFREEMDPIDNVEQVAENMQLYPLEHYLTGKTLLITYDPQLIQDCLDQLSPNQTCLMLWSKNFASKGECNLVEPWFGSNYGLYDIPQEWKLEWADLDENPDLHMPDPNPFIPTDFQLIRVENPTEYPISVLDSDCGCMWYKKDTKFRMPKAHIYFHLMIPAVAERLREATLCDLFINVVQQSLLEALYAATLSGYEFALEGLSTGMVIHVEGFSHKLPDVLETVIDHLADFTVTEELFENVKVQLKKCYYNEMMKTYDFAKMLRFAVTEPNNIPVPDRHHIISGLTMDMLCDFHQHFMNSVYIEGFAMGNLTPEDAVSLGKKVQEKLVKRPLPKTHIPQKRLLQLPIGELQCRVRGVNRQDTNSCVTSYYQFGPGTIRDACLNELLCLKMKEPVFNVLRTELQLGYSVFCQSLTSNGILGYAVSVETQADKFKLSDIEEHITNFLYRFKKTLNKMSRAQFRELVDSAITAKQVEDTQMGDEAGRYWNEILDRYYVFDRQEKEIAMMKTITLSDLKKWYDNYLSCCHRHVSFQVQGCTKSPSEIPSDTEEPIALSSSLRCQEEHFLQPMNEGPGFIRNVHEFKRKLEVYPYSTITS